MATGQGAGDRLVSILVSFMPVHHSPGDTDPDLRLAVAHLTTAPERCCEDLESERAERHRGFESIRFRPSGLHERCADPVT